MTLGAGFSVIAVSGYLGAGNQITRKISPSLRFVLLFILWFALFYLFVTVCSIIDKNVAKWFKDWRAIITSLFVATWYAYHRKSRITQKLP